MKTNITLLILTVVLSLTLNAQELTKGSAAYYEALKISYQTKINWVQNSPAEHALAVESNWYDIANSNVLAMEEYKSLAEASPNGIYLVNTNRNLNTVPQPGGGYCGDAAPFCTDYVYNFACGTDEPEAEVGPNYDCLYSQPNPAWYYMLIENSGDVVMSLSAPSDIDYIIWGPFSSPTCDYDSLQNVVDCSYSATNEETPEIGPGSSAGATTGIVGEYYLFLITNFSNNTQDFTLEQIGGTGITSQSIVSATNIKNNSKAELEIHPNPATDKIQITGLNNQSSSIQIIDITGSLIKETKVTSQNNSINISDLKQGIYILKYEQNNKSIFKKFIVK